MKIGVTETYDPAFVKDWDKNLCSKANVIITKHVISPTMKEKLLQNKHRIVLHATITGVGGTFIEPHVPIWQESINSIKDLINSGFPADQVVVRVDPIIPVFITINRAEHVIESAISIGISRIRFSVMDMYDHVRTRFISLLKNTTNVRSSELIYEILSCYDGFHAKKSARSEVMKMIVKLAEKYPNVSFEVCTEPAIQNLPPNINRIGCVSIFDLKMLGIEDESISGSAGQRQLCLCPKNKVNILGVKPMRCKSGCIYCYWKD